MSGPTLIIPSMLRTLAGVVPTLLSPWRATAGGPRIGSADWSDLRSSGVHRLAHQARSAPGDECRAVPAGLREPLRHQPITAVMAGRGDRIVFSEGPGARPTLVRSVRKTLLAMLYGQPVQD
ncbi:hypothetical protein KXV85_005770, partial [Aspergillus fumigatus]